MLVWNKAEHCSGLQAEDTPIKSNPNTLWVEVFCCSWLNCIYNFPSMLCIDVHAEPPLVFLSRQNQIVVVVRPIELVGWQSGRPAAELPQSLRPPASVHATARYRPTRDGRVGQTDFHLQQPPHWPLHSSLLFAKDVCTARGRCFNRPATEASRRPVTSLTPLPRTLQVRAACVAV